MPIKNLLQCLKNVKAIALIVLICCAFALALYPEQPARLLTSATNTTSDVLNNKIHPSVVAPQFLHVRKSIIDNEESYLYRNWIPVEGTVPMEVHSGSFTPTKYMAVVIAGISVGHNDLINAYIECENTGSRLRIFNGSVNVNIAEAHIQLPDNWCSGTARTVFKTAEKNMYTGVGAVYEISAYSYFKTSFLGLLPYFLTGLTIISLVMFVGAAALTRCGWANNQLPSAFVSLGIAAFFIFYFTNIVDEDFRWSGSALILIFVIALYRYAGSTARQQTFEALKPYFGVWAITSVAYFALLSLAYNGLGHSEPTFRFWPAAWIADAELPWFFTEGVRHNYNLKDLYGGGWMPTDRPPFMVGALLLLSDAFALLQSNNDGNYLRGSAYNTGSILLNTLWMPAVYWLLKLLASYFDRNRQLLILIFIGCLPFAIFNSIYGWPKALGAAFALVAFGLALKKYDDTSKSTIFLFPILCALSMLAHMSGTLFLLPIGLIFFLKYVRNHFFSLLSSGLIALVLLGSWSLYKHLFLPSEDPVTKYALTGSFAPGSGSSLLELLAARYKDMTFSVWLDIKQIMFLQVFMPINNTVTQIGLYVETGADQIDRLRGWDFMFLSKGNVAVVIFCLISLWIFVSRYIGLNRNSLPELRPFFVLLGLSILAWILITVLFFAPPVLHHWPQAAIFGLALGGSVITCFYYPSLFQLIFIGTISYTGLVWVISPLQKAIAIDPTAAAALAMLIALALTKKYSIKSN